MSSIKRYIVDVCLNLADSFMIKRKRHIEIKKFKDPRREEITNTVKLTKDQEKEIDTLFLENYGEKIPYTWHRHYTAFTNSFDKNYFPELLYIPELEHYMNIYTDYVHVYSDKNLIPVLASYVGIRSPKVYLHCSKGLFFNADNVMISIDEAIKLLHDLGEAFCKPTVDTCSGIGCRLINFKNGIDTISSKNVINVLRELGEDFVIQERLICHSSIRAIYSEAVNTFRIMTYRWKDSIYTTPSTFRIGRGGAVVDNIHHGGMCISIDDDGALHKTAVTEFKESFTQHPDTGVIFLGYVIPDFPKVLASALRMHESMPQLGIVQWDFTIDSDGIPVLIEANTKDTSIQLIERPLGKGPFGERTPEILRWMKVMKQTKATERHKFAFGKMPQDIEGYGDIG